VSETETRRRALFRFAKEGRLQRVDGEQRGLRRRAAALLAPFGVRGERVHSNVRRRVEARYLHTGSNEVEQGDFLLMVFFRTKPRDADDAKMEMLDADTAANIVQDIVGGWTDPCGAGFTIENVKTSSLGKVYKTSFTGISEIDIVHLVQAYKSRPVKGVVVDDINVNFESGSFSIFLGREEKADDAKKRKRSNEDADSGGKKTTSWIDKLLTRVDAKDADAVRKILKCLESWDGGDFGYDFKANLKPAQSSYSIVVSGVSDVPLSLFPPDAPSGTVNVTSKNVVFVVKRTKPLV
jgi:hypothetical protein